MQIFMLFIGTILMVIGVKLVYDARLIVKKYFSMSDSNKAVLFLKFIGTIFLLFGAYLAYKNFGL